MPPAISLNSLILILGLLIASLLWRFVPESIKRMIPVGLSLLGTFFLALLWRDVPLGDDAGIVLKYMDNFARGYFYSYNSADGPVFGISGFLHGLFAGLLSFSGIFTSEQSLMAANAIGLILVCYFSWHILAFHIGARNVLLVTFWGLLFLTSPLLIINAFNGLETSLHLAIILGCVYCYLTGKLKNLCWLSVIAIISKLDAVPIVTILVLAFLTRHRPQSKHWMREMLYGCVPLLAWIVVSTAIFGSPLPQSGHAKFLFHRNASDHWFPFLESLFDPRHWRVQIVLGAGVMLYAVLLIRSVLRRNREWIFKSGWYAVLIIVYVVQYAVYNPAERMGWYYVVPMFLAGMQFAILLYESLRVPLSRYPGIATVFLLGAYLVFAWPSVGGFIQQYVTRLRIVENERIAIGKWVREHSVPSDTLVTGFGHIARESGLYTVDYSGLNSKIATDLKTDLAAIVTTIRPRWIVIDTLLTTRMGVHDYYTLRRSFFNLTSLGRETWRVYERLPSGQGKDEALTMQNLSPGPVVLPLRDGGMSVRGNRVELSRFGNLRARSLVVGLTRQSVDRTILVYIWPSTGDLGTSEIKLARKNDMDYVNGYTMEWTISLTEDVARVTFVSGQWFDILNPVFVDTRTQ